MMLAFDKKGHLCGRDFFRGHNKERTKKKIRQLISGDNMINGLICHEFVLDEIDRNPTVVVPWAQCDTLNLMFLHIAQRHSTVVAGEYEQDVDNGEEVKEAGDVELTTHPPKRTKLENYSLEESVRMKNFHKHRASCCLSRLLLHLIIVLIFQRLIMISFLFVSSHLVWCDSFIWLSLRDETLIFFQTNERKCDVLSIRECSSIAGNLTFKMIYWQSSTLKKYQWYFI